MASAIASTAAAAILATAGPLVGQVVGVADGDTLTLLIADRAEVRIRLAEIDAPEIGHGRNKPGQPYGQRARQSLAELCYRKPATIRGPLTQDRYGRTVARVICDGIDANAEQVRRGFAWFYRAYGRDRTLAAIEADARADRRGLWADPNPVPPWDWRHK